MWPLRLNTNLILKFRNHLYHKNMKHFIGGMDVTKNWPCLKLSCVVQEIVFFFFPETKILWHKTWLCRWLLRWQLHFFCQCDRWHFSQACCVCEMASPHVWWTGAARAIFPRCQFLQRKLAASGRNCFPCHLYGKHITRRRHKLGPSYSFLFLFFFLFTLFLSRPVTMDFFCWMSF